jgi:hypothetical protein
MISEKAITYATSIGRLYGIEEDIYPSVTSVLKGWHPGNKPYSTDYMSVGTLGHHEALLEYKPDMEYPEVLFNTMSDEEINLKLDAINLMWNSIKPLPKDVINVEFVVYNPKFGYAGRGDIIHKSPGKIILGDIKTGQFYNYYGLQLGGYYEAAKDTYDIEAGQLYILDSNLERNPGKKVQTITYDKDQLEEFGKKFCVKAEKYNKEMMEYVRMWGNDN